MSMTAALRASTPDASELIHAVQAETQHANEALRLLNEVGCAGLRDGQEPEWTAYNLSVGQLLAVAQVQATLAHAAAVGRLADETAKVAAATRIAR